MPSIEIVCVGQRKVTKFTKLPFHVYAENKLVSHRAPSPLFQPDFDLLEGCIYHLVKPVSACTAYHLVAPSLRESLKSDRDWWTGIYFLPKYAPTVRALLAELLEASPTGELVFTSDYQFGPGTRRYKRPLTLKRFWELHDAKKLHMNALYRIRREARGVLRSC